MATKTKPKTGTAVSTRKKTEVAAGVPAHLANYESKGTGIATGADDVLIPMARVLDAKSPELIKGKEVFIKGAEAGDIYIKNSPSPIIKGEAGFLFQSCLITRGVVEWLPRGKGGGGGGGFVTLHKEMPKDMEMVPHPENKQKLIPVRKGSGNPLVETRYHGGFLIPEDAGGNPDPEGQPMPLVIPFASSGHGVAKAWNMLTRSKQIGSQPADLWLVYYRIKTRARSRADQNWFVFDVTDAGEVDKTTELPTTMWCPEPEDVERGAMLHKQMLAGQKQFAAGDVGHDDDGGKM